MPILETRNLTKIYPGAEQVVALNQVSLAVEKGELVAIMETVALEIHFTTYVSRSR